MSAPSAPTPRQGLEALLRLVRPEEYEELREQLDALLTELASRHRQVGHPQVDLPRIVQALSTGCFRAKIEQGEARDLTTFRRTWLRDRDRVVHHLERLAADIEQLYARFPYYLAPLDKAEQLPKDTTIMVSSATAIFKTLDTLQACIRHDPLFQLNGTGRPRGNQPARAVGRTRALLRSAGVPADLAEEFLRLFGLLRQPRLDRVRRSDAR